MQKNENSFSWISSKYPTYRDDPIKSSKRWIPHFISISSSWVDGNNKFYCKWFDGKRIDDNAEGLWRVHDKLYDLNEFIDSHPGGKQWLELTKGVDITEQFETHHIRDKAELLLPKFYARDAKLPRNYNFTYNPDGFYRTLKREIAAQLPSVDRRPEKISKLISEFRSAVVSRLHGLCAGCEGWKYLLGPAGWNVLELLVNHRSQLFPSKGQLCSECFASTNLSLLNFTDCRVSHAMSHHLYPNYYYDLEISTFEPWLQWIPRPKTEVQRIISPIAM